MRYLLLLLVLCACGGPSETPPPVPKTTAEADARSAEYRTLIDGYNKETGSELITVAELEQKIAAGETVVLLDIREPAEQKISTLRGAIAVPPNKVAEYALAAPKDATVVCYCTAGYRSGVASVALSKRFGRPVLNLDGGIVMWFNAGGEVVTDGKATDEVHAYGPEWAQYVKPRK